MGPKLPAVSRVGRIRPIAPGEATRTMGDADLGRPRKGVQLLATLPAGLREVAQRIGTRRARRVWRLVQRGVVGTLPELCAYDWLKRQGLEFEFQTSLLGGRTVAGGAVVDFLIFGLSAQGIYVWRIQGEHWHQGGDVRAKDDVQRDRLLHAKIGGVAIVAVVDLWESDIYDRYPDVFEFAEYGEGLRG